MTFFYLNIIYTILASRVDLNIVASFFKLKEMLRLIIELKNVKNLDYNRIR